LGEGDLDGWEGVEGGEGIDHDRNTERGKH